MHSNLAINTFVQWKFQIYNLLLANVLRSVNSKGLYDGKGKRNFQGQSSQLPDLADLHDLILAYQLVHGEPPFDAISPDKSYIRKVSCIAAVSNYGY
jgi:hypothetical protein